MSGEYITKLKQFASDVDGELTYDHQPTKTLGKAGWSRLTIRIPHPAAPVYFIAFSGANSTEVYSGFYAKSKLPLDTRCKITQRDPLFDFLDRFRRKKMTSGRPTFDKLLSISCNNKFFLDKLTTDHEIAKFLEENLRFPFRFEVKTIDKNIFEDKEAKSAMITLNANKWIVDPHVLHDLLHGFSKIVDRFS